MAIVPIPELFRDHSIPGDENSPPHQPIMEDVRDTLGQIVSTRTLTMVYVLAHSWGWFGTLAAKLQTALGSNFLVVNASIGGQRVDEFRDHLDTGVTTFKDADYLIVLGPINSILADHAAADILDDFQGIIDDTLAAIPECKVIVCSDGPFKPYTDDTGANGPAGPDAAAYPGVWTQDRQDELTATRAGLGNLNDIHAYVDLYPELEDPEVPETMYHAYRRDYFHPSNTLGMDVVVSAIVAQGNFEEAEDAPAIKASKPINITQDFTTASNFTVRSGAFGFEPPGQVAPVVTRNGDGVQEGQFSIYHAQYNNPGAGWGELASVDGGLYFKYLALGPIFTVLKLVYAGLSILFSRLQIAADNTTLLLTSATYGGGNGVGLGMAANGSVGYALTTFNAGGGGFGLTDWTTAEFYFNRTTGHPTFGFKRNGVVFSQFVEDSANLIVGNPTLTNGVFLPHNANAWSALSDEDIKDNITDSDIEQAAERIAMVRVRDYDDLRDPEKRRRRGVIAQEVMELYPELVSAVPGMTLTEEGDPMDPDDDTTRPLLGFQYGGQEILMDLLATNQWLMKKVAALEEKTK